MLTQILIVLNCGSLKQELQIVSSLRHIICTPIQPVFALSPKC